MSDELIRLQQQFAIYRSEYAILLAGAKECEARAEAADIARAHWEARARIAEGRVAELEAQLAAPWRPVTEPPTTGQRVRIVLNAFFVENSIGGYYWVETPRPDDGFSISTHADMIRYWQPLPAPPID